MTGLTLIEAQKQLDLWLAANAAVASGQEYQINTRKLRRVDAAEIRRQIDYWRRQIAQLQAASGARRLRISYGVPH